MVTSSLLGLLLSVLQGGIQPAEHPIVAAVYSAYEGSDTNWRDLDESLSGLELVNMIEADVGTLAYGQNSMGQLVLICWGRQSTKAATLDQLTSEAFEWALGSVLTQEDYNSWSAGRATVRGAVLEAKSSQSFSVVALHFSSEGVEERSASPDTPVTFPVAFVFK